MAAPLSPLTLWMVGTEESILDVSGNALSRDDLELSLGVVSSVDFGSDILSIRAGGCCSCFGLFSWMWSIDVIPLGNEELGFVESASILR